MLRKMNLTISNELEIYRLNQGIRLIDSTRLTKRYPSVSGYNTCQTVADVLKLSCCIYFENTEGMIYLVNEHNAEFCGLDSAEQARGKSYFEKLSIKTSEQIRKNDKQVMQTHKTTIFEELVYSEHEDMLQVLSIKTPWYNEDNKLIGLFGCSIILGQNSLAENLMKLSQLGLLNPTQVLMTTSEKSQLTKRQLQCAQLLIQGKTTKEIARQINLSPRTVEHYLEHLKDKFNCRNKTELVIKLTELLNNQLSFQ